MAIVDTINSIKEHINDAYGIVEEKGGTIPQNKNLENLSDSIGSISGGDAPTPLFNGHYDKQGLKEIGYDDETIEWYQKNGVAWNQTDDYKFILTNEDKSFYGLGENDFIQGSTETTKKQSVLSFLPLFNLSKVSLSYAFNSYYSLLTIPKLDTSKVTNMSSMFAYCYALLTIPQINTSLVSTMNNMFVGCYSLMTIPELDTSKVTNMGYMFSSCYSLEKIPQLNTSLVNNMQAMFYQCYSLKTIPQLDTSKVTNMSSMFYCCYNICTIDLSTLDTSKLTSFSSMFTNCGRDCKQRYGAYADGIPYIYVKDETAQNWVLTKSNGRPTTWTTTNVVIKGSADDPTLGD